MLVEDNLVSSD